MGNSSSKKSYKTKPTNTDELHKLLLAAANYFTIERFVKKGLKESEVKHFFEMRTQKHGGVFWCWEDVLAALEKSKIDQKKFESVVEDILTAEKMDIDTLIFLAPQLSSVNHIEICLDDTTMPKILQEIKTAQKSIHVSFMTITNDWAGRALVDALVKKAEEKVEVRVMVDEFITLASLIPTGVKGIGMHEVNH